LISDTENSEKSTYDDNIQNKNLINTPILNIDDIYNEDLEEFKSVVNS